MAIQPRFIPKKSLLIRWNFWAIASSTVMEPRKKTTRSQVQMSERRLLRTWHSQIFQTRKSPFDGIAINGEREDIAG